MCSTAVQFDGALQQFKVVAWNFFDPGSIFVYLEGWDCLHALCFGQVRMVFHFHLNLSPKIQMRQFHKCPLTY